MNQSKLARLSGFVYLVLICTGIFGLAYVPSSLIVWDNPAKTVTNIHNADLLFRLGILSEIMCFICFLLLPLLLYRLLSSVSKNAAVLMVAFAVVSIPVSLLNLTNKINILSLLSSNEFLKLGVTPELSERVMYLLTSFNNGTLIANIFWGIWLFPLGYLVIKSSFIPKIIGLFLMLGCFGYITEFVMRFIFSMNEIPWFVNMPSALGEFGICLWLLIFGVKERIENDENS